jgi:hypothetical protein
MNMTSAAHARLLYREVLETLAKFRQAEADYAAVLEQEVRRSEVYAVKTAASRADARAEQLGIAARMRYNALRLQAIAAAYMVEAHYMQHTEPFSKHADAYSVVRDEMRGEDDGK